MTDFDRVAGDPVGDTVGDRVGHTVGVDDLLESTEDEATVRRRRRWGRIAVQVSLGLRELLGWDPRMINPRET